MVFSYYKKLSTAQKRIYLKSDGIPEVPLPDAKALQPLIPRLISALEHEDRDLTEDFREALAMGLTANLVFLCFA